MSDSVTKKTHPLCNNLEPEDVPFLRQELEELITNFNTANEDSWYDCTPVEMDCVEKIIDNVENIDNREYFIQFGIWDDDVMLLPYSY